MKNSFKEKIFFIIIGAFVISTSATFAYSYIAQDVGFTPTDNSWNVDNTKDALDDLYSQFNCESFLTGQIWNFVYFGGSNSFIPSCPGYYKLEVWGAQGGNYSDSYYGGFGGYSTGTIYLNDSDTIFITVGRAGQMIAKDVMTGGYNGGGNAHSSSYNVGSGGGATHIAKVSGELKNLSSYKGTLVDNSYYVSDTIILVAGGGGGSYYEGGSYNGYGGSGGGYIGGDSSGTVSSRTYKVKANGGTQTGGGSYGMYYNSSYPGLGNNSNGSFGLGGSYQNTGSDRNIPGGGAGFFGGGATVQGSAAGGSGYIGNSSLTDKAMYCYRCSESSNTNTKTISTTGSSDERDTINCPNGYSSSPISKCAKAGNGHARITYLGS